MVSDYQGLRLIEQAMLAVVVDQFELDERQRLTAFATAASISKRSSHMSQRSL